MSTAAPSHTSSERATRSTRSSSSEREPAAGASESSSNDLMMFSRACILTAFRLGTDETHPESATVVPTSAARRRAPPSEPQDHRPQKETDHSDHQQNHETPPLPSLQGKAAT